MHSHRRPRGRILFEVLCAVSVGASFIGAWVQTGAWAFLGPAFVFTLFGLYWSFDMFGQRAVAAAPGVESVKPASSDATRTWTSEIDVQQFGPSLEAPSPPRNSAKSAVVEQEVTPEQKPKRRSKKARTTPAAPVKETPAAQASAPAEPQHEQHIEPLFEPQPFVRQQRPAFGKRGRGAGPRALPAA